VGIPLSNFDIAEFTGAAGRPGESPQTSPSGGASVQDTVYDLQGVVSHSGTLHGVRSSRVTTRMLFSSPHGVF
jgi:hypothetical protein